MAGVLPLDWAMRYAGTGNDSVRAPPLERFPLQGNRKALQPSMLGRIFCGKPVSIPDRGRGQAFPENALNKETRMLKTGLLCGFVLAASATLVQAQPPLPLPIPPFMNMRGTPEDQTACQPDAVRLCREVLSRGEMAVLQCFQHFRPYLTPACRAVLQKYGQ